MRDSDVAATNGRAPTAAPLSRRRRTTTGRRRSVGVAIRTAGAAAVVVLALVLTGGFDGDEPRQVRAARPEVPVPTRPPGPPATTTVPAPGTTATSRPAVVEGGASIAAALAGGAVTPVPDGEESAEAADGPAAAADPEPDPGPADDQVTAAPTPAPRTAAPPVTATSTAAGLTRLPEVESALLGLMNADRNNSGVPSVSRDGCMDAAASGWARSMAEADVMSHSGNGGASVQGCRGANAYWGDNVGNWQPCSAPAMQDWWMGSPSHETHILDATFSVVGIGVWSQPDGHCYFQVYFGS